MNDVLLIQYQWWGNGHIKNRFWCASWECSKEVHDYNPKDLLVKDAIKNGWKYKVIRNHRDGSKSIIETNCEPVNSDVEKLNQIYKQGIKKKYRK